jgi:hypothetical protein
MKFINNLMRCVHLKDTKTLWENQNSPWWNVKEHYVGVKSMLTFNGWPPFAPFVIIFSYNLLVYHALGFRKANLKKSNVTKYYKFLFLKSRIMPRNKKNYFDQIWEKTNSSTPFTSGKCSSFAANPMMQKFWENILHLLNWNCLKFEINPTVDLRRTNI